jgi:hypothetical protein
MVKFEKIPIGGTLRKAQVGQTVASLMLLLVAAVSPSFQLTLDSGQSFRLVSGQGITGQFLIVSAVLIVVAQIVGYSFFSVLAAAVYSGLGACFIFLGIAVPAGGSVLNMQVDVVTSVIGWVLDEFQPDLEVEDFTIRIGLAWTYLLLCGFSLICQALLLLFSANRNRGKLFLDESLD